MKIKSFSIAAIPFWALIASATVSVLVSTSSGGILTWKGSSPLAEGTKWNNSANWQEGRTPQQGDDLKFPVDSRTDSFNNMTAGLLFNSITFDVGGFRITGNALGLANGIVSRQPATDLDNRMDLPITLAAVEDITVTEGRLLLLQAVSGVGGGITKKGAGTLVLTGAVNNVYTGDTWVRAGTLELAKNGFFAINNTASLIIGDSSSVTVLYQADNQLSSTLNIIVNRSGLLNLNGHSQDVGNLTLNAGTVQTAAPTGSGGQLQLLANVVARSEAIFSIPFQFFPCRISGNVDLGNSTRTFTVSGPQGLGSPDLDMSANIRGSANLIKAGAGQMLLTGVNTLFTGPVTINEGTLIAGRSVALGSSAAGVTVNNSASLGLANSVTIAESLILNSDATAGDFGPSAALSSSGDNTWNGPIELRRNATVAVNNGSSLTVSGQISGIGGIVKEGAATLRLTVANSFDGDVYINAGVLVAAHSQALASSKGSGTFVNAEATLELAGGVTIGAGEILTLHTDGAVDALRASSGNNSWIGPIILMEPAARIVVFGGAALSLQGPVSATDPTFGLQKTQTGNLSFDGSPANTYTGPTTVNGGTLTLNRISGSVILGDLTIGDPLATQPIRSVVVNELSHGQISSASKVTVHATGLFDIHAISTANSEEIGSLAGLGQVDIGPARLRCGGNGARHNTTFGGVITPGTGGLSKAGDSTMILAGNNHYSGETRIGGGTLVVNGTQANSAVVVNSGGTLAGHGQVGNIIGVGGIIAPGDSLPGNSIGVLRCSSLALDAATTVEIELSSPVTCCPRQFDGLIVGSPCSLNDAILRVKPTPLPFSVKLGDQFRIIETANSVAGTFAGWPDGAAGQVSNDNAQLGARYDTGVTIFVANLPASQSAVTFETGNGNGRFDPDECNDLRFEIRNAFTISLTGIHAHLRTLDPGVLITQPDSDYEDLALQNQPGDRGENRTPFQVSTSPSVRFGSTVQFDIDITCDQGQFTISPDPFPVGELLNPVSQDNNTPVVFFSDGTSTRSSTINVSGLDLVGRLEVGVFFDPPLNADLTIELAHRDSPDTPETVVRLFAKNRFIGTALGVSCNDKVIFDDDAQSPTDGDFSSPTAGHFKPSQLLREFEGRTANGIWNLRLTGSHFGPTAPRLVCWTLKITPARGIGSGMCVLCPNFSISTAAPGTYHTLMSRWYVTNAPPGLCAAPIAIQPHLDTQIASEVYLFQNTGPDLTCIEVLVNVPDGQDGCGSYISSGVILDPTSDRLDYLPTAAAGAGNEGLSFYFRVKRDQQFLVFVQQAIGLFCSHTLTVKPFAGWGEQNCDSARILEMRRAGNQDRVTYSTRAPVYRVQSAPKITGPWSNVLTQPFVEHSRYVVTNTSTTPVRFYRLYKP